MNTMKEIHKNPVLSTTKMLEYCNYYIINIYNINVTINNKVYSIIFVT